MSDALTLALEELLEALRHDASWHHAPHAARRLISGTGLCLRRPGGVGLLHIHIRRSVLINAETQRRSECVPNLAGHCTKRVLRARALHGQIRETTIGNHALSRRLLLQLTALGRLLGRLIS